MPKQIPLSLENSLSFNLIYGCLVLFFVLWRFVNPQYFKAITAVSPDEEADNEINQYQAKYHHRTT